MNGDNPWPNAMKDDLLERVYRFLEPRGSGVGHSLVCAMKAEFERMRGEKRNDTAMVEDLARTLGEAERSLETRLEFGWHYADSECLDEGWCGPFDTRAEAVKHALTNYDSEDCVSLRKVGDVAHLDANRRARDERCYEIGYARAIVMYNMKDVGTRHRWRKADLDALDTQGDSDDR